MNPLDFLSNFIQGLISGGRHTPGLTDEQKFTRDYAGALSNPVRYAKEVKGVVDKLNERTRLTEEAIRQLRKEF
jgi:hypothetical protein